ncbi:MAG: methyl-accepting chemotaxis protein, partial [Rhodocyclaceae bacterium]|nr:methyl-accepting chemotaxis protein [Rhodocyclaceae bacterium]
MFKNLRIGVRLGIGFGLLLVLLLVISVTSALRLSSLSSDIDTIVNDRFPKTVYANNIIDAINIIARQLRNAYIFSGEEQTKAIEAIPPQRKIITENLEKLEATIRSDKGKELLARIKAARQVYVAEQDKFLTLLKENKREEIVQLLQTSLRKAQSEYMGAINDLIAYQTEIMERDGKRAAEDAAGAIRVVTALSVASVLLAIFFAWFVTRSITRPLAESVEAANSLAQGDLTVKIEAHTKDEIGVLMSAMQNMVAKLSEIISEVNAASEALNNAASQVSATAQSLSQSSSEQAAS